jgi:hypothetical protein
MEIVKKLIMHNKTLQLTADGLTETVVFCRIDQLTSTDPARQLSLMLSSTKEWPVCGHMIRAIPNKLCNRQP